jgi:hypothetical protein
MIELQSSLLIGNFLMVTQPGFQHILFISLPVRKRENLMVLLKSGACLPEIACVESFQEAETLIMPGCRTLAVIDHNIPFNGMHTGIEILHRKDPGIPCVLMLSHPLQQSQFTGIPCDGWIYDDFSLDDLRSLLASLSTVLPGNLLDRV